MEGQGTLIAKRWVVTAAHAVAMMRTMPQQDYVTIAGKRRKVSRIVLYPGYLESAARWDRLLRDMALPLEGAIGGGDSGGAVLVRDNGVWKLAWLTQGLDGDKADLLATRAGKFRMGIRGQVFSNSRISYYAQWIERVMQVPNPPAGKSS